MFPGVISMRSNVSSDERHDHDRPEFVLTDHRPCCVCIKRISDSSAAHCDWAALLHVKDTLVHVDTGMEGME